MNSYSADLQNAILNLKHQTEIAMIGPEFSGKSSLLQEFGFGQLKHVIQNSQFIESLSFKNINIVSWDVVPDSFIKVSQNTSALVVIVNASNVNEFSKVKEELKEEIFKFKELPQLLLINRVGKRTLNSQTVASEL